MTHHPDSRPAGPGSIHATDEDLSALVDTESGLPPSPERGALREPEQRLRAVRSHLEVCGWCSSRLDGMRRARLLLRSGLVPAPGVVREEAIRSAVDAYSPSRPGRSKAWFAAAAAVVGLAGAGALVAALQHSSTSQVATEVATASAPRSMSSHQAAGHGSPLPGRFAGVPLVGNLGDVASEKALVAAVRSRLARAFASPSPANASANASASSSFPPARSSLPSSTPAAGTTAGGPSASVPSLSGACVKAASQRLGSLGSKDVPAGYFTLDYRGTPAFALVVLALGDAPARVLVMTSSCRVLAYATG